jgi:hypothetical protein
MDTRILDAARRFRGSFLESDAKVLATELRRRFPEEPNTKNDFDINIFNGKINFHGYNSTQKKKNYIFVDVMKFKGIRQSGSKAPRLILYSPLDDQEYEVYSKDSEKFIQDMTKGWLVGRFTLLSRGRYIALRLMESLDV